MLHKKAPIVLWLALLAGLCSFSLAAQSVTATLGGTVTDEKGGVVPGAAVTVINTQTNAQRQVTTGNDGSFIVPLLPPSSYTLR
ncbi:MAG: carboxypeptidase-like regulatory domain-containing protein, partial [Pseudomonadota bacterium]